MWELRSLTTLRAATACFSDRFTFTAEENQDGAEIKLLTELKANTLQLFGHFMTTEMGIRIAS
jgi:hypothetical protein